MDNVAWSRVAKCPYCGAPHAYTEVKFLAVNDDGYWKIECEKCEKLFALSVRNPRESAASFVIKERVEGTSGIDTMARATEIIQHNLDTNRTDHRFNFDAVPLYVCDKSGDALEVRARDTLLADLKDVEREYANAVNYALSCRTPAYRHLVVHVDVGGCRCSQSHTATFYTKFVFDHATQQPPETYLLAGVTGCDIQDRLEGLHSKTDVMAILEKLLIRWHLISDQIVVAVPFVGHTYLPKADKMGMWTWLLSLIDPKIGVFITRSATFNDYKKVLEDVDGFNHGFLDEYGLANKLIAANVRKQDFHAKFYIGRGKDHCEVLSGSANIVKGPSIENISFRTMTSNLCQRRFIDPLSLRLPTARSAVAHVVVRKRAGSYKAEASQASPLAT